MKKISLFAAIMAGLLAVGCVQKEETAPEVTGGKKVTLNFELAQPQTKVAFDDQAEPQLQWTGTETMALVFGKYGEGGADNTVYATLPSTSNGVFSGTVEVPAGFDITDLQGFVIPAENKPVYNWVTAEQARINMNCPEDQTQAKSEEPNWTYCPFFYDLSGTITDATQTEFKFSGITVKSASDMIRFNIYGKHPEMAADEVFESITLRNTQNICTGTAEYVLRSGATNYSNNGSQNAPVVTLTEKLTIADKTSDNGIKVFMSYIGKSSKKFDQITVVTNKATYVKNIEAKSASGKNVTKLNVYQVGVDLSSGYVRMTDTPMYSADGGNTWSETIPASFTRLAVKNNITTSDLETIKAVFDAQTAAADLDLSAARYESSIFPAIFKGDLKLKSIVFPYNVNEIAEQAFSGCTELIAADFSTIDKLNYRSFYKTALKKIVLDKHITYLGKEVFRLCYWVEEIYYNVLSSASKDGEGVFRWNKQDSTTPKAECVVTVGPDAAPISYFISDNRNVVKIIMEYKGEADLKIGGNAWNRSWNLHTVIVKGTKGLLYGAGSVSEAGKNVTSTKYFVVPDGCTDLYKNHTQSQSFYSAFVTADNFTLIEQSAYDALQAGDQN